MDPNVGAVVEVLEGELDPARVDALATALGASSRTEALRWAAELVREAGTWEDGIRLLEAALAETPDDGPLRYELAGPCCTPGGARRRGPSSPTSSTGRRSTRPPCACWTGSNPSRISCPTGAKG